MRYFLYLYMLLTVISCSSDDNSSNAALPEFKGLKYVAKNASNLTATENSLAGSGTIGLEEPLGSSIDSNKKVFVSFNLEDGGSLTLHTYADSDLENGVNIVFTRNGDELETKFVVDGEEKMILVPHAGEEQLGNIDVNASETIQLKIDVHNSESPPHIIIWQAEVDVNVSDENLVLNSADTEENDNQPSGKGAGTFLGLSLANASLLNLAIEDATPEDEIGEGHDHDHEDE